MRRQSLKTELRKPQRRERGFTMVELLVVMGVSLFGLAGLMSVYTSASRANSGVGHSTEAIDVCERTMEELRSMSIANIEAIPTYGPITAAGWGPVDHHAPLGSPGTSQLEARNGVVFKRRVSAIETAASAGLVRIQVNVTWSDNSSDPDTAPASTVHNVSLEMIRTRAENL
jgi:prepilin-type N-terminal cleavage/methylation domain-containing protein